MKTPFFILGTAACHLCEQAHEIIATICAVDKCVVFTTIDIAEHEHWQHAYATQIPVVYHPDTHTALVWPFDQAKLFAFIEALKND
jgi:hypothetical protein